MTYRQPTATRPAASVLDFMARAAETNAARQCVTPGCKRLTLRRVCDRCGRDDSDGTPPEAA